MTHHCDHTNAPKTLRVVVHVQYTVPHRGANSIQEALWCCCISWAPANGCQFLKSCVRRAACVQLLSGIYTDPGNQVEASCTPSSARKMAAGNQVCDSLLDRSVDNSQAY
jgi:hypothetical protein